jgi:hypothetical protein
MQLQFLLLLALAITEASRDQLSSDCEKVLFDKSDENLKIRTLCVQDTVGQRSMILTGIDDTSMPCQLSWWLDHNPQGLAKCAVVPDGDTVSNSTKKLDSAATGLACADSPPCNSDVDEITNGYVRTMLSSAFYAPHVEQAKKVLSTICIEEGCRSTISKVELDVDLVQTSSHPRPLLDKLKKQRKAQRQHRHGKNVMKKSSKPAAPANRTWEVRSMPAKIAVIGLGSSTMALWFRKHLPGVELHVAELVPAVAEVAPCFGLNTSDPGLHLHVQDGRQFLQQSSDGAYDAILVDAFDKDAGLPKCFKTEEFFDLAKTKLAPGGALSFNLLDFPKDSPRVVKSLLRSFHRDNVWFGEAPGSVGVQEVITAFNAGTPTETQQFSEGVPGRVKEWFHSAKYAPIHYDLSKYDGIQDRVLGCSSKYPQ